MTRHTDFWIEDGSVLIIVEDTIYRLYRCLITRLSPRFFEDCCQKTAVPDECRPQELDSHTCFVIRPELNVSKNDFDTLVAYVLHDIEPLDVISLQDTLRLYTASSETKCKFQKAHRVAEKQLNAYMQRNPLEIDFSDYALFRDALEVSKEGKNSKLRSLLQRALYYSYITYDETSFTDENTGDANANYMTSVTPKPDAAIAERIMTQLSETFSPTLFQPPAALHMECTDVYAALWMDLAVQPAFADNGTANPFMTIRRLKALNWKRDSEGVGEERDQPCEECLKHMRQQWNDEAQSMWEMMDSWIAE